MLERASPWRRDAARTLSSTPRQAERSAWVGHCHHATSSVFARVLGSEGRSGQARRFFTLYVSVAARVRRLLRRLRGQRRWMPGMTHGLCAHQLRRRRSGSLVS